MILPFAEDQTLTMRALVVATVPRWSVCGHPVECQDEAHEKQDEELVYDYFCIDRGCRQLSVMSERKTV